MYATKVCYSKEQYFINYNDECIDCHQGSDWHIIDRIKKHHTDAKLVPKDLR